MNRFLHTVIECENKHTKETLGLKEVPTQNAEIVIDLMSVSSIRQAIGNDDALDPLACVLYFEGDNFYVNSPYKEVLAQWTALFDDAPSSASPPDVGHAVNTLAQALDEDRGLFKSYETNIANAFTDEYASFRNKHLPGVGMAPGERDGIDHVAKRAAEKFLINLIKSVE
jgi:hypothetical protein